MIIRTYENTQGEWERTFTRSNTRARTNYIYKIDYANEEAGKEKTVRRKLEGNGRDGMLHY